MFLPTNALVSSVLTVSLLTPLTSIYVQPREESKSPIELSNSTAPVSTEPSTPSVGVVDEISHDEIVGPKYTIRNSLDGARKNIPKLTKLTVEERALEFTLKQGGTQGLHNAITKLGKQNKIDPVFSLCVAWAETHLGKANKTAHNYFNLGNTDSGATKSFTDEEKGVSSFFWNMNHGKWMSGHTIIGTMSNEGRKRLGLPNCDSEKNHCIKCFSTGKNFSNPKAIGNWSTNVTNCMSAIYDKQVDETFLFRK